jgi:FMN phosphatase YigB (HAD superfamily)
MSDRMVGGIFFDIGDTLATASITNGGNKLVLTVLPGVISVLKELREKSIPVGIISNTPDNFTAAMMERSLKDAELFDFFGPKLSIYSSVVGLQKNSVAIFCFAADRAGFPHDRHKCIFVGENSTERQFAKEAGLRVFDTPNNLASWVKTNLI